MEVLPDVQVFWRVGASRQGLICTHKILPSFDYTQAKMLTTDQDDRQDRLCTTAAVSIPLICKARTTIVFGAPIVKPR